MIEASDIRVNFKRGVRRRVIRALDGFSITVNRGDVYGLLGPNGAGKSTAMYCFLGLIRPASGEIRVGGEIPVPGEALFRRLAYLPEEPHYHQYLTVQEALRYYTRLQDATIPASRQDAVIERLGLGEYRDLRLDKCSKGMKQKLGIATCLVTDPELVFLDEPTRGLDPVVVKEFRDIILEMNRNGTTFVINSHVLSEVEMVCNRVAIMDHGRVRVQDELSRLMKVDRDTYVVEYGAPESLAVPDYVTAAPALNGVVRGTFPATRLADFMRFAGGSGVSVLSCSLKRLNLEEAFFNVLKGGAA